MERDNQVARLNSSGIFLIFSSRNGRFLIISYSWWFCCIPRWWVIINFGIFGLSHNRYDSKLPGYCPRQITLSIYFALFFSFIFIKLFANWLRFFGIPFCTWFHLPLQLSCDRSSSLVPICSSIPPQGFWAPWCHADLSSSAKNVA